MLDTADKLYYNIDIEIYYIDTAKLHIGCIVKYRGAVPMMYEGLLHQIMTVHK